MEKEKIISISNSEKVWWIRVNPTNKSLEFLHEIICKLNENNLGLEYYDEKYGEDVLPKIEWAIDKAYDSKIEVRDEECGYVIVTKYHINIVLLKNSKNFNKLKNELENYFEFKEELK